MPEVSSGCFGQLRNRKPGLCIKSAIAETICPLQFQWKFSFNGELTIEKLFTFLYQLFCFVLITSEQSKIDGLCIVPEAVIVLRCMFIPSIFACEQPIKI